MKYIQENVAMCSAANVFNIALAAENVDICDVMYDDDPTDRFTPL